MTLVKKTIVLARDGAKGYITVVRVGSSIGAKVVIDYDGNQEFLMGLRVGASELIVEKVRSPKTELELDSKLDLKSTDDLSCIILLDKQVFAEGGLRSRINVQDIINKAVEPVLKSKAAKPASKNKAITTASKSKEVKYGEDKRVSSKSETAINKDMQQSKTVVSKEESRQEINKNSKGQNTTKVEASTDKPTDNQEKRKADVDEAVANIDNTKANIDNTKDNKTMEKELKAEQVIVEEVIKKESKEKKFPLQGRPTANNFTKDANNFYFSVKDRLDELFIMYPREEVLEKIIPSSKWVKINYDTDDYYVAGVLLEDDKNVTHIAYGVPGFEGKEPPKETACICDWLPLKNMEKYQGYWLIFQNAKSGEIIPKE